MHRAKLSRLSAFSVVFRSCSPCTEQSYQDSVYFLLSFAFAVHASKQRYQDSVHSVAVHPPNNAVKMQCIFCCVSLLQSMHRKTLSRFQRIFCCLLQLQSMYRAIPLRFSVFSVVFCSCSPCTEQYHQDSVYFLLSFAVAAHVPTNAITIQCIFCCLLHLQPMYRAMPSRFSVFSVVFCSCSPCTEQCHQDSVYFLLSFAVAAHASENHLPGDRKRQMVLPQVLSEVPA